MSLKGYLIEKYNNMGDSYTCRRLTEEAAREGMDFRIVGVHDSMVSDGALYNAGELLLPADFVINRYKWGKLKDAVNAMTARSYNDLDAYNIYINKFEQARRLRSDAFIMPRYVMGTALLKYEDIVSRVGVPFVAKGLERSMGQEVMLIERREDYEALHEKYGIEKEWLFQEFIRTSIGRDIRFYSIRGEALACMRRVSQGDFRANVALGAKTEPMEITDGIRQIARDIYEQTGLDFLGIDLLEGEDKPYFCEINVMPGLEGIETTSGVNVANRIIRTIKEDFENE